VKRNLRQSLVAGLLSLLAALALAVPSGESRSATETYKQNEDGLAKEFDAFVKAYHKGDDAGMTEAFAVFKFPNANEWFAKHFSAEDAARVNAAYGQQVSDAMNSLIEDMNRAGAGNKYSVHCQARGDVPVGTEKAGSSAAVPVKAVRVEQFVLEFQASSTRQRFLFMANFVYEGGAYRFVGGGGGPFWAKM